MSVAAPGLYLGALVGSFLLALLLTPVAAWLAIRFEIVDRPADNKFHSEATPYLGGIALAGGLIVASLATGGLSGQVLIIALGGMALAICGLVDDLRTVGPVSKLVVETGAALALWFAGVRGGLTDVYAIDLLLTVLWVLAITNAINMLDNMDGLTAGVVAIASFTFFLIAASNGDYLVGALALAISGASLGFLRHNFPKARIFMGDAGSLMLGFLLAAVGLKLDLVGQRGFLLGAVPILVLGVPIFDMFLVVVARLWGGRPIYRGGTDHSSHRLVSLGLADREVALVVYSAQMLCSALAVWLAIASDTMLVITILALAFLAGALLLLMLRVPAGLHQSPQGLVGLLAHRPRTGAHGAGLMSHREDAP